MIMIEGGDLVGKSTFTNKLLKHPALKAYWYRHLSKPPVGSDACLAYFDLSMHKSVYDRFHMSEPVYCAVRGETACKLTPEKYRLVDAHLRMLGALTVVISCTDDDKIAERHAERAEDEMYTPEMSVLANKMFREIGDSGQFHFFGVTYTMDLDIHISVANFATDAHVDSVVNAYLQRQAEVLRALGNDYNDGPDF